MNKRVLIHISVYEHKFGYDVAVYATPEEAEKGQANTARMFWSDRADKDAPEDPVNMTDDEVISAYFVDHETEFWTSYSNGLDISNCKELPPLNSEEN